MAASCGKIVNNTSITNKRLFYGILIDILCLIIVFIPIPLFKFLGVPFRRGFFCNDESLKLPYYDSTITSAVLFSVGLSLPILMICVCEVTQWIYCEKKYRQNGRYFIGDKAIHPLVWWCYKTIGVFLFGAALSHTITDFAKYSIGRLRPHWFDVCAPELSDDLCKHSGEYIYVLEDVCTGDEEKIREARLSFMSGHASFSFYCMTFLALYLQVRMTWKGSRLLKHTIQVAVLLMAYFTAMSRISDNKHHWSDVLVGSLQGIFTACVTVLYFSDLHRKQRISIEAASDTTKLVEANCTSPASRHVLHQQHPEAGDQGVLQDAHELRL